MKILLTTILLVLMFATLSFGDRIIRDRGGNIIGTEEHLAVPVSIEVLMAISRQVAIGQWFTTYSIEMIGRYSRN